MMSTDRDTAKRGRIVHEGVLLSPTSTPHRHSSIDTPPQPPNRSYYYDMSPQVPQRRKRHGERRSNSRSPGRHDPGNRRGSYRHSRSSSRRLDVESSSVSTGSSHRAARRRSRSSSGHRRSSSGHRRSSSGHRTGSRRNVGLNRSSSENRPGAYSYYDDIDDYAEAAKAKESRSRSSHQRRISPRRSDGSRRSPRRSDGSRRSSDSSGHQRSSHQDQPKIYDDAFGDYTPNTPFATPPATTKAGLRPDQVVGELLTPTSTMTETSYLSDHDDSDSEIALPGAYASNYDGDDLRLSRVHGRTKSRRSHHMRVSMGGLAPLDLLNGDDRSSSVSSSCERSSSARKESRRSTMMRAASERTRRSSNRRLMEGQESSASGSFASFSSSLAVATAIEPPVSESSESEEEVREEIVNDEYGGVENQSPGSLQIGPSESTATGDVSEDEVVAEVIKPKLRRKKRPDKRKSPQQTRRDCQRYIYYSIIAVFLVVIGGGVVFFVFSSDLRADKKHPTDINNSTDVPSTTPSASPTPDMETLQPTESYLYDPPSPEDCIAIQNNEMVMGQSNMTFRNFNLHFDVTLDDQESIEVDTWLTELLTAIESYFVPTLAGCDDFMLSSQDPTTDNESSRRRLALLRYVVANAEVDGDASVEESCTTTVEEPCFRVIVNIKVYLKGKVRIAQLLNLIVGLIEVDGFKGVALGSVRRLGTAPVLVDCWSLSPVFKVVTLARMESASISTSSAPSASPSAKPSASPTTVAPSPTPSVAPSPNPTTVSSQIPSVTPTQKPTVVQSSVPSAAPSTREPSEAPSEIPTPTPSFSPSAAPSQTPTDKPSNEPSAFPSDSPTKTPPPRLGTPPPRSGFVTLDFAGLPTISNSQCYGNPLSPLDYTYENLQWNNFGVADASCLRCDGAGTPCSNAVGLMDTTATASIQRQQAGGTFDMFSMWVYNPTSTFTLSGFDEGRALIHSELFAYIGFGWHQLDLSAFENITIFEIENTDADVEFDIAFSAIQLRFNN